MKRKVFSLVLGLALVMTSGATVMAAEAPEAAEMKAATLEVGVTVDASSDKFEMKEGVFVSLFEGEYEANGKEGRVSGGYTGIVNEKDMERLADALGFNDEEKEALLHDYAANKELQDEQNELFAGITEDMTQEEQNEILNQADELRLRMVPLFEGKVLDKAVELGLLSEITLSFVLLPAEGGEEISLNEKGADSEVYTIKAF